MKNSCKESQAVQHFAVRPTVTPKRTPLSLHRVFATSLMILMAAADKIKAETKPQPVQELFQTDLVYPQEAGELQLTLAPAFRRERDASVSEISVSLEYGLTDAWQVEVEWA